MQHIQIVIQKQGEISTPCIYVISDILMVHMIGKNSQQKIVTLKNSLMM